MITPDPQAWGETITLYRVPPGATIPPGQLYTAVVVGAPRPASWHVSDRPVTAPTMSRMPYYTLSPVTVPPLPTQAGALIESAVHDGHVYHYGILADPDDPDESWLLVDLPGGRCATWAAAEDITAHWPVTDGGQS